MAFCTSSCPATRPHPLAVGRGRRAEAPHLARRVRAPRGAEVVQRRPAGTGRSCAPAAAVPGGTARGTPRRRGCCGSRRSRVCTTAPPPEEILARSIGRLLLRARAAPARPRPPAPPSLAPAADAAPLIAHPGGSLASLASLRRLSMQKPPIIGIDLGTTNSCAAIVDRGRQRSSSSPTRAATTPSRRSSPSTTRATS